MKAITAMALLVTLAFAGCVQSQDNAAVTTPSASSENPLPDFKPLENTTKDWVPTLAEAPQWKQGEWWKIRLTDHFEGKTYEATRVVVGQEGDHYLVGMPSEEFSDTLMVMHLPGFGQINKEDLSWDTHNVPFSPLHFPLEKSATWDARFEGQAAAHALVTEVDGLKAKIHMDNGGGNLDADVVYDAEMHEIVKYEAKNYAGYEVIDHGYDYSGMVTVPHMFKLVFQQFRTGPVVGGSAPNVITDTVKVDATFDRVSFGEIFAAICTPVAGLPGPCTDVGQPVAGGYYEEKATGPGGKTFTMTVLPNDPPIRVQTFAMDNPGGDWTFQHTNGGPAVLGSEGIAYHTYNVMMPSGEIMASTGEHKHGGQVGGH